MKHIHLLIPDLFPPREIAAEACANLQLPALERLLARGRKGHFTADSLENCLCAAFGADGVAPVRAAADGLEVGEGYWLCADPVNLHLQRAQMLLLPDVAPRQEEATALCADLNAHFAGMGMHFYAPHPRRWYVRLEVEPQMTTTPLRQVTWHDAKFHQPQGVDALRWQRFVTEIQMLMYAHAVNQVRAARGELIISSLWMWGGGRAKPLQRTFDAAGGDSELAGAFASVAGLPRFESLQAMLGGRCEEGLWVCGAPGEALQRGDLHAWRTAVLQLEQEYAQTLLNALQTGRLRSFTLQVLQAEGGRRFELTRGAAWSLWRGAPPLAQYAV